MHRAERVDGRNEDRIGDLLAAGQRQKIRCLVCLAHQHHAAPRNHRRQCNSDQPRHVRQRHRDQSPIGLAQAVTAGEGEGGMNDSEMGQLRAFRPPRGSRGIEDHRDIFFGYVRRSRRLRRCGEKFAERPCAVRRAADRKHLHERGKSLTRRKRISEIGFEDEYLGAAVVQQEFKFGLSLTRPDRNDDGADTVACEDTGKEFPAIAEEQGHAVAMRDAEAMQLSCYGSAQPIELAVGDCAVLDDRGPLWKALHEIGKHRGEGGWTLRKAQHPPAVVVLLFTKRSAQGAVTPEFIRHGRSSAFYLLCDAASRLTP